MRQSLIPIVRVYPLTHGDFHQLLIGDDNFGITTTQIFLNGLISRALTVWLNYSSWNCMISVAPQPELERRRLNANQTF